MSRLSFGIVLALVLAAAALVFLRLDLSPEVSSDFFFSSDDPQLQSMQRIEELFPSNPQIILHAAGEITSTDYLERMIELTERLEAIEAVRGVQSLARGPLAPTLVPESPIWSRLLLARPPAKASEQPLPKFSQVIVTLDDGSSAVVEEIEALVAETSTPAFALRLSGVPYVVEMIRRHLNRDLRAFSTAAFLAFGLLIIAVYRSWRIAAATLATCASAAFLTLAALHLIGFRVGILTANLLTIVFVLTLSHIVFLTANWQRRAARTDGEDAVADAVRITFQASFWSMVTTVLGFASLLFASAKPLRELGLSGAIGSLMAILVAYLLFPRVLVREKPRVAGADAPVSFETEKAAGRRRLAAGTSLAVLALALAAALGWPRVDTDPSLLSYFEPGGEIRTGLEIIDRHGGSSPLYLVVRDPGGEKVTDDAVLKRLGALQNDLENDPMVGSAVSLPVLLDEARRNPLAVLLNREKLLDLLGTDAFGRVADQFVTAERDRGLFFLRLREAERDAPRRQIVDRLAALGSVHGVEVELVGGLYELQGQLGDLVASSLITGLGGLFTLFLGIAFLVSRAPRPALAMVVALLAVPIVLLGFLGHLRQPLDVIASPAANVAIALGIDSMIHLVMAVRRRRAAGDSPMAAWQTARTQLARPIFGAALILAVGFGLFTLSSFPPTQRFGLLVASGTVLAAILALEVLPFLAGAFASNAAQEKAS